MVQAGASGAVVKEDELRDREAKEKTRRDGGREAGRKGGRDGGREGESRKEGRENQERNDLHFVLLFCLASVGFSDTSGVILASPRGMDSSPEPSRPTPPLPSLATQVSSTPTPPRSLSQQCLTSAPFCSSRSTTSTRPHLDAVISAV